jgi:peptide/nickel transport system substrate-binding protein
MKKTAIALLVGAGVIGIAALAQSAKPLVVGSVGQPVSMAPGKMSDGNSILVQQQVYDRLLSFKEGTAELDPEGGLAKSWNTNANSTVWTFNLRTGVRFHDNTPLNAEAVKFNIEYWWDNTKPGFFETGNSITPDIFQGYKNNPKSLIKSVSTVGPYTVRVTLAKPMANFDEIMATGYFGIASPTAIKKAGGDDKYGTPAFMAVGTGPFVMREWRTGDRIILTRNANYWRGKSLPKASGMTVRFIPDAAARIAELKAGNVDLLPSGALPYDTLPQIKGDANLAPVFRPSFNVGYLGLNQAAEFDGKKNPLANLKVRQAITNAINKKEIVEAFYGENGVTNGHIPPLSLQWAYSKNVSDYEFNVEKAKKLMTEAGYANGFEMDLWYMPVSRPYYPSAKPIAEAFAQDLAKIGIKASLKTKDWGAYLDDVDNGKLQSYMLGWTGDYNDPDNFYTPLIGSGNVKETGYNSPALFKLLDDARAAATRADKAALYGKVAETLFNDIVKIPVVHSRPLLARRAALTGWIPGPLGSEPLTNVEVK